MEVQSRDATIDELKAVTVPESLPKENTVSGGNTRRSGIFKSLRMGGSATNFDPSQVATTLLFDKANEDNLTQARIIYQMI